MEHQENAGDRQNDEEETGNSPQAERIRESKAMALDLGRENMEEEVVVDEKRALQIGIRKSGSEDRAPYR